LGLFFLPLIYVFHFTDIKNIKNGGVLMARQYKCYGFCGEKYPKEELQLYKTHNHCKPCYERKVKETEDREELYRMVCQLFNLNFPTGLMLRQIKQFREERNYTYKNIYFTIDYIVRLQKVKLQPQYGIALVPHYYDEMLRYYKNLQEKRANTVIQEKTKVKVYIEPTPLVNEYREKKFINMEDLLND